MTGVQKCALPISLLQGTQKTDVAVYESLGNAQGGGPFYDGTALLNEGYTYQLFTPGLLSLDTATVTDGVLNEDGPAYRALVLDNETAMSRENMEKLLGFARNGLTIVFANNLPCISTSLTEDNETITALMEELLAQESVIQVGTTEEVGAALLERGIIPAAYKSEAESAIITVHREAEDKNIYFLYNSSEETVANTITFKGEGTPYILDTWNGTVSGIEDFTAGEGSVTVDVSIAAGDAVLLAVGADLGESVDTAAGAGTISEKAATISIRDWDLTIESWTSGDAADAAVTAKDVIYEGHSDAISWSEIEGVGNGISGIGTYTAVFDWEDENVGAVISLPEVGETFEIMVNDNLVYANQITKEADISDYLVKGENTLKVIVASSLQNAVNAKNGADGEKQYGIISETVIKPYVGK